MATKAKAMSSRSVVVLLHLAVLSTATSLASAASSPIFFDPTAPKYSCINDVDGSTLTPGVPLLLADVYTSTAKVTMLLKLLRPDSSSAPSSSLEGSTMSMCVLHMWTLML